MAKLVLPLLAITHPLDMLDILDVDLNGDPVPARSMLGGCCGAETNGCIAHLKVGMHTVLGELWKPTLLLYQRVPRVQGVGLGEGFAKELVGLAGRFDFQGDAHKCEV